MYDDIYKRWGLELNSKAQKEKFLNRLIILFGGSQVLVKRVVVDEIALSLGVGRDSISKNYSGTSRFLYVEKIIREGFKTDNVFHAANSMEAVLNGYLKVLVKFPRVIELLNSPISGFCIVFENNRYLTYPAGERILDDELVVKPLSFLTGLSAREFADALESYSMGKWVACAESTRKTIEEYLRHKFGNSKSLENNRKELSVYIKRGEVLPEHLRVTIDNILRTMDTHYNESSKHGSKTKGKEEAEFLIYQTGLLLRLIQDLNISR